jgi:hypothetical protein
MRQPIRNSQDTQPDMDHGSIDRTIGCLTAQVESLQKAVETLSAKVDDLTATKNQGLGILLAVGGLSSLAAAWITKVLDAHWK